MLYQSLASHLSLMSSFSHPNYRLKVCDIAALTLLNSITEYRNYHYVLESKEVYNNEVNL